MLYFYLAVPFFLGLTFRIKLIALPFLTFACLSAKATCVISMCVFSCVYRSIRPFTILKSWFKANLHIGITYQAILKDVRCVQIFMPSSHIAVTHTGVCVAKN